MKQLAKYKIMFLLSSTLLLGVSLQSCEEVIDIDLNSSDPVLSIDGLINLNESAQVQLSYTSDYFTNEEPKHEENAQVTITTSDKRSEVLTHQGKGLYTGATIMGQIGVEYQLEVKVNDQTYQGKSKLMMPTEIVSLVAEKFDSFGAEDEYNLEITLKNNLEEENYFLVKYYLNDEEKEESFSTLSHEYFPREETVEFTPFNFVFNKDDKVTVKAYSIDKETYDYYDGLEDIVEDQGGSTPYNPKSNMGKDVMGYFRVWSVDVEHFKITEATKN